MAPSSVLFVLVVGLISLIRCTEIVPPLYRYDDYERCLQNHSTTGVYCFVKIVFREDHDPFDSPRIITDFRRNLLDWGICIDECQRELMDIDMKDRQRLFEPKFPINFRYIISADLWDQKMNAFKNHHEELINICVNNRLERNYTLHRHAYSEIEYCTSKDALEMTGRTPKWLMVTFYAIILILIGVMTGANVIDWLALDKIKDHIIVSSFSMRRNWERLTEQSKSELYRDFGYIDGVRFFLSVCVMTIHYLTVSGIIAVSNPKYAENAMNNPFMIDLASVSVVSVQIFFAISGLLLVSTVFKDVMDKSQLEVDYFWDKILNRLVRIAPVYFFFLLLSIVVPDLPGMEVGPAGYKMLVQEQARCLNKWWANVLFLNNHPPFAEEQCNIQSWYLAADLQLFLVALIILAACCKYRKRASLMLWNSFIVAVAIIIGITYIHGLESSLPIRLSEVQFQFTFQSWLNHVYLPSYSNFNSYTAGMVVGYLYHQHKHNKLDLYGSRLFNSIKQARLPLLALTYVPTFIFYHYEFPRSSWWTMIHAVLYRNVGVIAACVTIIECFRNPPGRVRKFLASKPLTSLGKLSYCLYIVHVPVGRFIAGNWVPAMMELPLTLIAWSVPFMASTFLVGIIAYFCIEQPFRLLLKHYIVSKH